MTTRRSIARYGWIPDLPDHRDKVTAPPTGEILARIAANPVVSLRTSPFMPAVWNQLRLGACTAHSVAAAYVFAALASGAKVGTPSRLFIYYMERLIEGTVDQDSGAQLRDGFKVLAAGAPPETDWPYDIARFADVPPALANTDAKAHLTTVYQAVPQSRIEIQAQLVQDAPRPISIGFSVYDSFESEFVANTGNVPLPGKNEALLGGHAVLISGYDDHLERYEVRNSWDVTWGDRGYFTVPYEYFEDPNLASDLWAAEVAA